jgi:hypothetical protein
LEKKHYDVIAQLGKAFFCCCVVAKIQRCLKL